MFLSLAFRSQWQLPPVKPHLSATQTVLIEQEAQVGALVDEGHVFLLLLSSRWRFSQLRCAFLLVCFRLENALRIAIVQKHLALIEPARSERLLGRQSTAVCLGWSRLKAHAAHSRCHIFLLRAVVPLVETDIKRF